MTHRTTHRNATAVVSLAAALALGTGCASDRSIIAQATNTHSQLEPAIITDEQLAGYVQAIGDRIVNSAREQVQDGYEKDRVYAQDPTWIFEDVQFHLVNSETLNAFTTGGTHIYLYSELFETTQSEDEFAAVVAHEFAHVMARHVAKGTNRQYAILGGAALAAVGGYALGGENKLETGAAVGGLALAGGQFAGMGFGRDDEREADEFGFNFYAHAGYDVDQFSGFFQTLIDKGLDSDNELASGHPLLKNRVADAKKWAREWKEEYPDWRDRREPPIASGRAFDKFQDRAVAIGKSTPSDKTLAAAKLMFAAFPSCVAPTDQPEQARARERLAETANEPTDRAPAQRRKRRG